jgi:2-succinyl-6-hydroxy-2,4-cyclohexadiene-1-carboxylate synthase
MNLVLLHGFAHTPASWREVVAALPPGLDVRALATPGHDATRPIGDDWDATLAAFEVPRDAVVVGYSFGARVALGLLARDAIAAAILIGVNPGLADPRARAERRAADEVWADRLRVGGLAGFLAAWERQPLFASQARAPAEVRARRLAERAALDPEALAATLERLGLGAMPPLAGALAARADRAHLVVGADDDRFVAIARELRAQTPALGLDELVSSGHDPTLETPVALANVIARTAARLGAPR